MAERKTSDGRGGKDQAGAPARTERAPQQGAKTQASGRNAGTPHQRGAGNQANDPQAQQQKQEWDERDEANKRRFVDQSGLEASDLPDGGRSEPADTDWPRQLARNTPDQHGGELGEEGGLRGDREVNDADQHGGRKRN